jgi:hypothetical protein
MIEEVYQQYLEQMDLPGSEEEYLAFEAGWLACRGFALALIDNLGDDNEAMVGH